MAEKKAAKKMVADARPLLMRIGIGRLLGMIGGIITFVGALLPWATVTGGVLTSPETYIGVTSGFFGVLVSQLGFFGMIMMMDGKKKTSFGGLGLGIAGVFISILALLAVQVLSSLGGTMGVGVSVEFGVYICIVGALVLMIGSILTFIEASKPSKFLIPPAKPVEKGKPLEAIIMSAATLGAGILLLAYPWLQGKIDALGVLLFLFGLILFATSFYAFKIEYWSWGTVLILLILLLLFAVPGNMYPIVAYADALALVLFFTKTTYGVGVWKIEQARDEERRKAREDIRTENPDHFQCPRCKNIDMYICDDGSSYCRTCKAGFVNIRDLSAKPKSSMQGN